METVYLFDLTRETIKPIIEISSKETDHLFYDTSKTRDKVVGRQELKVFFGDHYDDLMSFAKDKDLKLDKKNDLVVLFDHYASNFKD
jgi:hypothetical protein